MFTKWIRVSLFVALSLQVCVMGCGPSSSNRAVVESDLIMPGGYSNGDTSSSETIAAAEFAVKEQSKSGPALKLSSIVSAKTQVVAGTNFELELVVVDGAVKKAAQATVYVDLSQNRTLSTWMWK